jgi:MoxR-like ATPase
MSHSFPKLGSVESIIESLAAEGYICNEQIATVVYLAAALEKPILVEGPPGVGKTELAKSCAELTGAPLVRLQCYEGLDESKAIYEWKYGKQLLYTQLLKTQLAEVMEGATGLRESIERLHSFDDVFFSKEFLEPRPLLQAIDADHGVVLLVDEIDKADFEFESLLLEVLSDFQVSIPELGTLKGRSKPLVFLTSNDTRDLSDALKRRCLHLHIDFPTKELEGKIVRARVPQITEAMTDHLTSFVSKVRELDLKKLPSVSETIDWAKSLVLLHADSLDEELVRSSLNALLKYEDDLSTVVDNLTELLSQEVKASQAS